MTQVQPLMTELHGMLLFLRIEPPTLGPANTASDTQLRSGVGPAADLGPQPAALQRYRSIRAGLMAVAHDINRMLGWVGISRSGTG